MKWILLLTSWIEKENKRFTTNRESVHELGNWLSHALVVVIGIPAGIWLTTLALDKLNILEVSSIIVFVFSFNLLYTASAVYHYMKGKSNADLYQKFDHIGIFFLIAGTYTPFLVIYMNNYIGRMYLLILWALVVVGVIYKIFLMGRYKWISLCLYLFMGWILIFNFSAFSNALPSDCLKWIFTGGLFYTLGVVFYVWKKLPFNHFIWHLFVGGGSVSHFVAVYYCIQ